MGLENSIILKNILLKLQTEEDLTGSAYYHANSVEVGEINKEVKVSKEANETLVNRKYKKLEVPKETEYVEI